MTLTQAAKKANERAKKHERPYFVYRDPDTYTETYQVCSQEDYYHGPMCWLDESDLVYHTTEGYYK